MAQRRVLPLVRQKQHRAVPDRPSPTGSTGTNQLSWLNWHRCGFNLENDRGPCQIEPAQLAQLARRFGGDFSKSFRKLFEIFWKLFENFSKSFRKLFENFLKTFVDIFMIFSRFFSRFFSWYFGTFFLAFFFRTFFPHFFRIPYLQVMVTK